MSWAYRIVDRGVVAGEHQGFAVHEVHFDGDRVTGFGAEPAEFSTFPDYPSGDGSPFDARAQIRDMLQRALAGIDAEIVDGCAVGAA